MPPLEWQRHHPEATGSHSKCRRYSVNRAPDERTWEVWRMVPGGAWFAPLASGLESEEAAQKCAEADALSQADRMALHVAQQPQQQHDTNNHVDDRLHDGRDTRHLADTPQDQAHDSQHDQRDEQQGNHAGSTARNSVGSR